ncbi:MAG: helix-turn-helix transcriptional regulator [Magnetococcales bacterium]|nr:helix-turn-helix transcriptional regulator [Magnetococcales bacterium]
MNSKQEIPGFYERLLRLIGEELPYTWASRMGIAKATMHGLLRKATPSSSTLTKIAQNSTVSLSWLLTGRGEPGESFLAPTLSDPEPPHWLRDVLNLEMNLSETALIRVKGDGMEPTLRAGDLMMMDQMDQTIQSDAIYLLKIEGEWIPKRIQHGLDGSLMVLSDNPAYLPITVSADKRSEIVIAGRVIWIGRRI